jgi:prefoldin subunit 5
VCPLLALTAMYHKTIHDSSQEEKIKILNSQIDELKSEKEKHLSSLPDQMSRLSFDTNVIQSLSKKVDEINASNNNVTAANTAKRFDVGKLVGVVCTL